MGTFSCLDNTCFVIASFDNTLYNVHHQKIKLFSITSFPRPLWSLCRVPIANGTSLPNTHGQNAAHTIAQQGCFEEKFWENIHFGKGGGLV